MTPIAILGWLACGFGVSALALVIVIGLEPVLRHRGAVAVPGPDGRGETVPRGGGLAIVVVTVAAAAVAAWLEPASAAAVAGWLVPAVAVAAVSLRDDFRPLPAAHRLVVHVAAAMAVVAAAGPPTEIAFQGLGPLALGAAAWPVMVLWVAGLTNAFNFMDGIDGIAGITAAVGGLGLAVVAAASGAPAVAIIAAALAAGSLGFLVRNWPPARVFMGDVGSTFCGFTIAAVPLLASGGPRSTLLAVAVMATWPFVFDAGFTLLKRLSRRENVFEAHCGHLYQRLVVAGWSHRAVAGLYGLLAGLGACIAALPIVAPSLGAVALRLALSAALLIPVLVLTLVQVSEAGAGCRSAT